LDVAHRVVVREPLRALQNSVGPNHGGIDHLRFAWLRPPTRRSARGPRRR
jgi:hypothetical protein